MAPKVSPQPAPSPASPSGPAAAPDPAAPRLRWRAVVTAALVLGSLAIALAHYHDGNIISTTARRSISLSLQTYTAPLMVGLMFAFLVLVNPVLRRLGMALSGAEIAVVTALLLIVAPLPRFFSHSLVGSVGYTHSLMEKRSPAVRDLATVNVYEALPERALLPLEESRRFDEGLAAASDPSRAFVHPADVPWGAWVDPLLFWAPLLLVMLALSISFGYMLYRQWAHHELVPFPLAQFVADLVSHRQRRRFPDIFYNRPFWIGLGLMLFIFMVNGLHGHFEKMIEVPTRFNYYALSQSFPFLQHSHEGYSVLRGTFYFTAIAVAFLLATEISFTAWATWPIMIACTYVYYLQTGQRYTGVENQSLLMGAWWAMALLLVWSGRTYYLGLLRAAAGGSSGESRPSERTRMAGLSGGEERQSVWAARLFLLSCAVMVGLLCWYGLPIDMAVLFVLCLIVMFLVMCRLVAEMGLPWTPLGAMAPLPMLLTAMGPAALGAKVHALLAVFSHMTLPQTATIVPVAPMVMNAAHVETRAAGSVRSAAIVGPFVALMLIVSVGVLIWLGYSRESHMSDVASYDQVVGASRAISQMGAQMRVAGGEAGAVPGALPGALLAESGSLAQRWGNLKPAAGFVGLFSFGFALVLCTGVLRLKFPRFPLHPLPMVLLGTWLMSRYWWAFLFGWLIKQAILKSGGGRLFEKSRPFFVGIVVGQAVVLTVWVVINVIVYHANDMTFKDQWWSFMNDLN